QNEGEYFEVISQHVGFGGNTYTNISGNTCKANCYEDRMGYFRKISAQTAPTIVERVSKLEADVEALKGGQVVEATYVPQEGDIVVVSAYSCGSRNDVGDI